MISLSAAGGVAYLPGDGNNPSVVMIYKRNVWDLPKGKIDEGESREDCARREVSEETGISTPEITEYLTDTYHEYEREGLKYGKTTYWFAMRVNRDKNELIPQQEEGIEKVQWIKLNEALEIAGYENLKKVLLAFKRWYLK